MVFDYGPMAKNELEAYRSGDLGGLGNDESMENKRSSLWDMIAPSPLERPGSSYRASNDLHDIFMESSFNMHMHITFRPPF